MRPISLQTYPKQAALWRGCLRYAFRAVLHATLHANPRGTLEATMGAVSMDAMTLSVI